MTAFDVIVLGGGAPGEHCAGAIAAAGFGSPSSSGNSSAVSARTGPASRPSLSCVRGRRSRALATSTPAPR